MTQHDDRISDIFYYFQEHTSLESGRTVGRKIGGVQELLVKKLLMQSQQIREALLFEQPLRGLSGATHKVEFSLHKPLTSAWAAVGDEVTLRAGSCVVRQVGDQRARLILKAGGESERVTLEVNRSRKLTDDDSVRLKNAGIEGDRVWLVELETAHVLSAIESKRVGAQRFSGSDKLGSGIQTIEKAKQASLVALDLDLAETGAVKPLQTGIEPFVSVVVLGNGVHWTEKDLSVLCTFVDHVFLIPDDAIIRYAEFVRAQAEAQSEEFFPFFMKYFRGLLKTPDDDFEVSEADLRRVCPKGDPMGLVEVLIEHLGANL